MTVSKPVRLVLFVIAAILFATISYIAFGAYQYFSNDLMYSHAMRDPATRQLISICIRHKLNTTQRNASQSLSQPLYTDDKIIDWLRTALPEITTFDYARIDQQIATGERYFTPDGWCGFIEALSEAGWVANIKDSKLHTEIAVHANPKIVKALTVGGAYTWDIEFPVSYKLISDDRASSPPHDMNNLTLDIEIVRSSSQTNPDGIGISKWDAH